LNRVPFHNRPEAVLVFLAAIPFFIFRIESSFTIEYNFFSYRLGFGELQTSLKFELFLFVVFAKLALSSLSL